MKRFIRKWAFCLLVSSFLLTCKDPSGSSSGSASAGDVTDPLAPVISVTSGGIEFYSGTSQADFGSIVAGDTGIMTFSITNNGLSDLIFDGSPLVTLTGEACFLLDTEPDATIAAGATSDFVLQFSPGSAGVFTGLVSLSSNDSVNTPFEISLTGTGSDPVVLPAVPVISRLAAEDDTFGTGTAGTDSDGITLLTSALTITGTADPLSDVNLYEGTELKGSTTADDTGNWFCDIDLAEGGHILTARAVLGGSETADSAGLTLTVDTTAPELYPDIGSADRVCVMNTTSLTTDTLFTAETGTVITCAGTGPYTVSLTDIAGNTATKASVYTGATGLGTAVESAATDMTIYIAEDGSYALGGGPGNYILFSADITLTLKGKSTGVVIDYNRNDTDQSTIYFNSPGTLILDTLSLSNSRNRNNENAVGNISTDTPTGSVYLRNIKKDALNSDNTELVDISGASVFYWNGSGWTEVTAATGNGWIVTSGRKQFAGTEPGTYW